MRISNLRRHRFGNFQSGNMVSEISGTPNGVEAHDASLLHSVRLIGIDTPERGRPYHLAAKRHLDRLVDGRVHLVKPASTDDHDRYGRLLRYVSDGGRDAGRA